MNACVSMLGLLLLAPTGDRERGLQLYEAGRYGEAVAAFRKAIDSDGPSPELSYNLALALWRSGDRDGAEVAVEEMGAQADGGLVGRRYGLLGALRYDDAIELRDAARAMAQMAQMPQDPTAAAGGGGNPVPVMESALKKAYLARNHSARAGAAEDATPPVARNLERALKLCDELEKELEELKKQQEQQQQDQQQQDQKQDPEQQQDPKEQEQQQEQQDPKQQQDPQEQEQEQQPSEQKQDPQEQKGEPESSEPQSDQPRGDAPGEQLQDLELSPEQKKRLMDTLKQIEDVLEQHRARMRASRQKVKRDW